MKKILIPCDFSDASESALNYAIELSKYISASLVLLHVYQVPVAGPDLGMTTFSFENMRQDSLDALENLSGKIRLGHAFSAPIDYYSETGTMSDVINSHVEKLGIDLVVMGISGHGSKFMKAMVGSASVDVAKSIPVPLIIVPPATVFKKIQNITYACDFAEELENNASLIKVKYLTTLFNAGLSVLHVIPEGHKLSPKEMSVGNFIERSLENAAHKTFVITEKNISQGLLDFIDQHQVDMVILEPKKHPIFHKLFSFSTTNEIVFNSPVPVLTIHAAE